MPVLKLDIRSLDKQIDFLYSKFVWVIYARTLRSLFWVTLLRRGSICCRNTKSVVMLPQKMKKAVTDNPKKLANLVDLVNLPSTLREFLGKSQSSRLGCFMCVWSYIKTNNLQDPNNKNVVHCDENLRRIALGKHVVELAELPALIKLHFPKESK
ncbi:hypothetical protein Nepgr_027347 [Nepenthes gracilis]|uniref:DM2 domain-containing protein n=1 Tax=Nepenthes gracilis TaxID=150966 RepID=A0AAD3TAN2_NEPGR|nr:hypothetical protein Nepgr_027347 [Nepenthes gracilis]